MTRTPPAPPARPALRLAAALMLLAPAALAGPPRVAADIPPIAALAARAMAGVGAPELILPPGASPHDAALRPSDARRLAQADLVIWVGPALTPWMAKALDALAPQARRLTLLDVPGLPLLPAPQGHAHHGHDDHGHDDAGGDAGGRQARGDGDHDHDHDHDHDGHGHDEQAHGDDRAGPDSDPQHGFAPDPHAWLDPAAAKLWLQAIAAELARIDPENAARYAANAAAGAVELEALTARVEEIVAPARGRPYIVFHDAYRYFERRFGIAAAAAVSPGDARKPGARQVARIRRIIRETGARCVFAEPQFPPRLVATLIEGTGARAASLDPLGAGLAPGPGLYPALIEGLARDLRACLAPEAG
ncbi:zinc ABC transporter substrate-binding protein [Oceanicella actignis]|uniref:High-affinity zinc uptake system protein ZnuA n=1 Tax=Oceanicella actignis TaxID=1189325 RepID=A0A1M7S0H3_9RHOB|nr:zinc ABC transporter substrate-binding protein [Oceanicella actignis]SES93540.1 zinc transport system substrate-binding protein [Oceanicella actignis]SHN51981.1 zinc transport system substrate-binding protein [Oceanicella actignis]